MQHPKDKLFKTIFSLVLMGILLIFMVGVFVPAWAAMGGGTPGDLDITFSGDGYDIEDVSTISYEDAAQAVAIDGSGRAVVAGFLFSGSDYNFAVLRYLTDGTLDNTFDGNGMLGKDVSGASYNDSAYAVAIADDGDIIVAGESYNGTDSDFALVRLNPDGTVDTGFGVNGVVTTDISAGNDDGIRSIAIYRSGPKAGYIVVGGYTTSGGGDSDFAVAQYTPSGALDLSTGGFNDPDGYLTRDFAGNDDAIYGVAIDGNNKIVVVGSAEIVSGDPQFTVCRYDATGVFDAAFNSGAPYNRNLASGTLTDEAARAVAIQSDGKILVTGYAQNGANAEDSVVLRLMDNGNLDTGFASPDGYVMTDINGAAHNDRGHAIALESGGNIIVGCYHLGGDSEDFALLRYDTNGVLDPAFGSGGMVITDLGGVAGNDVISGLALQADGKAVVVGKSGFDTAVARYETVFTGSTYYVDINNLNAVDDPAYGTDPSMPWKTLHYAFGPTSPVVDNDIINIQAGTYSADPAYGEDTSPLVINKNGLSVFAFGTVVVESSSLSASTWQTGVEITADQVKLQGLEIRGFPLHGLRISGSRNIIDNCMIHDNSGNGIFLSMGGDENAIQNNCDIHHNSSYGIYVGSMSNIVDFCHVHDNSSSGIFIDGFNASGSGTQIINNCEIFQNFLNGIEIYESPNNLIRGNNNSISAGIYNNGSVSTGNGIYISGTNATNNDIIDNRIYYTGISSNAQSTGIYISGAAATTNTDILGNSLESHTTSGIWVTDCDVAIKGNKFFNNKNGIWVDAISGTPSPTIWNNLIYSGFTPAMDYGIHLTVNGGNIGNLLTIYHNTIDGAQVDGIVIDNYSGGTAAPDIFYNIISNPVGNGINNNGGAPNVGYNNVVGFGSVAYNNVTGAPGTGGIEADPGYADTLVYDYHLTDASFCVDSIPVSTSDPVAEDLDGTIRPQDIADIDNGGTFDMGCYELLSTSSVVITPGEYWVDSSGGNDETGDGSELNPWQTLHHAINNRINTGTTGTVSEPYILNVAAGQYTTLNNGGFEPEDVLFITQNNLTIQGAGIGNTVIDGTGSLSNNWIDGLDAHLTSGVIMKNMEIMNFHANGIHMGGAVSGVVESCSLHNNGLSGIMIETNGAIPPTPSSGNIVRTGCEIYHNGSSGIYIRNSMDNQIINNLGSIYDNGNSSDGGMGIYIEGSDVGNNDIINNHIYSTSDPTYRQNVGIYLENVGTGSQIDIEQNLIESHPSSGIYIFGGDARIKRNTLMNNLTGVYVFAVDGVETSPAIWNNLIYSGEVPGMNNGIYLQMSASGQITSNLTIYNNTIDRAIADGLYIDATLLSDGVCVPSIYYNIISNSQNYGINNVNGIATMDFNGYNDVFNSGAADYAGCTAGAGSILSDPVYVVDGTDYHLGASSPCIDASDGGQGPDLDGNSRPIDIGSVDNGGGAFDMGCYEAVSVSLSHTVLFIADSGGSISGTATQTIPEGGSCTSVTAVPDSGYEFVGWTGDYIGSANPLTISTVTSNMTVTANFRIKPVVVTRTVRFIAEAGGSISGSTVQTVSYGGNCSPVTAVPDAGYDFIGWSGGFSGATNPLTITNVTSDMTIYANFREPVAVTYSVRFIAGAGGKIDGNPFQSITEGGKCGSVTAVPDAGYSFVGWTGDYTGTENPLTVLNVTSNMAVTANFEVKPVVTYTVNFIANAGGHINGNPSQIVEKGGVCAPVTAEADTGYEFTGWTGDRTSAEATLTIANIMSNMVIYANFKEQVTHTVSFIAGPGGKIDGSSFQTVADGGDCTAVTAMPDSGYLFAGWEGDYSGAENPLTIVNVTSNMTINAGFEENTRNQPPEKPELIAPIDNAIVPAGPFLLRSGPYADPENDPHAGTWWQVSRFGSPGVIYTEQSATDLDVHEITQGLDAGLKYSWRAGYQDAGSGQYSWSDGETFVVGESTVDRNIPPVNPGISMSDYRMVSFIQWHLGSSAEDVFGSLMNGEYDTSLFRLGVYDPTLGSGGYREYPNFTVEPGQTYWLLARDGIDLIGEGVPVSTSVDFCISLKFNAAAGNGWNMIAPPNDRDYRWGDLQVTVTDGQGNTVFGPMPVSQLPEDNEYIDVRTWGWDQGAYTASTSPDFLLERYNGYWVRTKQNNVLLCFPADAGIALHSDGVLNSIWNRLTAWAGNILSVSDTAYADASNDTPPMPLSGLETEKAGGSVGCFIGTMAAPLH